MPPGSAVELGDFPGESFLQGLVLSQHAAGVHLVACRL